ncbi:hypothetical protein KUCAC02_005881 [Chaenocephalus aceratus]|uniref:Uncharacterized protein n=1 Tax=Chaenocephalus aceratus TaxID=36190 RepID=A0ACB9WPX7_CHAAC|nr:hypothetical protein KUCAC02_005881 [Chaenocephalus aceratus]
MEEVVRAAQSFTSVGGGGGDRLWVVLLEEVCRLVVFDDGEHAIDNTKGSSHSSVKVRSAVITDDNISDSQPTILYYQARAFT